MEIKVANIFEYKAAKKIFKYSNVLHLLKYFTPLFI